MRNTNAVAKHSAFYQAADKFGAVPPDRFRDERRRQVRVSRNQMRAAVVPLSGCFLHFEVGS
jgi:hypothetical protein